jgi:hypothetical protein
MLDREVTKASASLEEKKTFKKIVVINMFSLSIVMNVWHSNGIETLRVAFAS